MPQEMTQPLCDARKGLFTDKPPHGSTKAPTTVWRVSKGWPNYFKIRNAYPIEILAEINELELKYSCNYFIIRYFFYFLLFFHLSVSHVSSLVLGLSNSWSSFHIVSISLSISCNDLSLGLNIFDKI